MSLLVGAEAAQGAVLFLSMGAAHAHLGGEGRSQQEAGDEAEREHRAAQREVGQAPHAAQQQPFCGPLPAGPPGPGAAVLT